MKTYDLIIIGAGPAGITAGIYAKNFGMNFLLIGEKIGGLINSAYKIENYPGIFGVTGKELTEKFNSHLNHLNIVSNKERIEKIIKKGDIFEIITGENEYQAKSIILAFGTEIKKLDIKNIEQFENKGVYYRAGDNALLFKNKTVAIIGGANCAVMGAVTVAEEAKKVYLIYRKDKLRADDIWVKRIKELKNVEIIYNANVVEVKGKDNLEKIILDNGDELKIDNLVIEAGFMPNNVLIKDLGVSIDEKGYIIVDKAQKTNIEGVFAAGDITTNSNEFRQIITAAAEGSTAVLGVFNFLSKK
jgi:thioredoxin reductase (NADPH)